MAKEWGVPPWQIDAAGELPHGGRKLFWILRWRALNNAVAAKSLRDSKKKR